MGAYEEDLTKKQLEYYSLKTKGELVLERIEKIGNNERGIEKPKLMNLAQEIFEKGNQEKIPYLMQLGKTIYNQEIPHSKDMFYRISQEPSKEVLVNTNKNLENILESKRRITISGEAGAGKGSLKDSLSNELGYEAWSMGDMRRAVAERHGYTIHDLNEIGKKEFWTDEETDNFQKELGKKQNLLAEGRLSWYFMPSLRIYLDVREDKAAQRIYSDELRKPEGLKSLEETKQKTIGRKQNDLQRYRKYYGINPFDQNHYHLIIDASNKDPEEVFKETLKYIKPNSESNFPKSHI